MDDADPAEPPWRNLLDAIPDGVAAVDREGRQVFVNEAFCTMTGWSRAELEGSEPPHLYWPPEHRAAIEEAFARTLDGGDDREYELTFMRKSGERFPVAVFPGVGVIDGTSVFIATVKDLTQLRRWQEELSEARAILNALVDTADLAWWDWDLTEDRFRLGDAYFRMLGYEPEAWPSTYEAWAARLHPDDMGETDRQLQLLLSDELSRYESEHRVRDADGAWRWILARGRVVERAKDGEPIRIAGISQDIHRLKTQERRVRELAEIDLVRQVAGGIARDFENLIFTIDTHLDALREADADARKQHREEVEKAVAEASELVGTLLRRVARDAGEPEPVELGAFLGQSRPLLSASLDEGVDLDVDVPGDARPIVVARRALENALLNLVINARDAVSEGGTIRIHSRVENVSRSEALRRGVERGPYVTLEVEDDGDGMEADVLEHAADALFSTKGSEGAAGLGLSMAKRLAEASDGYFRIESVPGEGTSVTLAFPLRPESRRGPPPPPEEDEGSRAEETLLVVDDEVRLLDLLEAQLTEMGYRVVAANNPRHALATLEQERVHLLLTDIVMPSTVDGLELARRARVLDPTLPVVFMSGYLEEAQKAAARPLGPVLRKPFTMARLDEVIRSMLDELSAAAD